MCTISWKLIRGIAAASGLSGSSRVLHSRIGWHLPHLELPATIPILLLYFSLCCSLIIYPVETLPLKSAMDHWRDSRDTSDSQHGLHGDTEGKRSIMALQFTCHRSVINWTHRTDRSVVTDVKFQPRSRYNDIKCCHNTGAVFVAVLNVCQYIYFFSSVAYEFVSNWSNSDEVPFQKIGFSARAMWYRLTGRKYKLHNL